MEEKTTIDNLRPICSSCNRSMGSCNLEEFKKHYGFNKINKSENKVLSE